MSSPKKIQKFMNRKYVGFQGSSDKKESHERAEKIPLNRSQRRAAKRKDQK